MARKAEDRNTTREMTATATSQGDMYANLNLNPVLISMHEEKGEAGVQVGPARQPTEGGKGGVWAEGALGAERLSTPASHRTCTQAKWVGIHALKTKKNCD